MTAASPKPPTPATSAAVIALRIADPHTWTRDAIAAALRVSTGWVSKALATPDARKAIEAAEAKADPVGDAVAAVAETKPAEPGSTDTDIAQLEEALRTQRAVLGTIKDPVARANAEKKYTDTLGQLTKLRLAAKKQAAPEREAERRRGGGRAAARLRQLLEEAIGRGLKGGEAA